MKTSEAIAALVDAVEDLDEVAPDITLAEASVLSDMQVKLAEIVFARLEIERVRR